MQKPKWLVPVELERLSDRRRQVCNLETSVSLKKGTIVSLKDVAGRWRIVQLYQEIYFTPRTDWKVGGL